MGALRALGNLNAMIAGNPLTRRARLSAWTRFGWWQVVSRLKDEVAVPWVGGQRLVARRGMTGATGNIYVGLHEFTDMMLPLHVLRRGDLFLDIGANIGSYTVLAAGVCGARCWSFEPDPGTARSLRRNIEVNGLSDRVTVYECALGPVRGTVSFSVGMDAVNKVLADGTTQATRTVRQEALDDLLGAEQPFMAKIDVEGYEEPVLRGASRLLANPSLKLIEIETTTSWIEETLLRCGFECRYYDPFKRALTVEPNALPFNNSIYVRDIGVVAERLTSAPRVDVLGQSI